eukprot:TRINITY_DN6817_c0_g1_i4.p1 TRINITY_DN6817_c0_g1~~TRINITY_DN6817_c0_g1_i4.p1  ORF type:complete len:276 (+),score=58.26 TRINITY_DN6817_c0_g1_i4:1-828(+)
MGRKFIPRFAGKFSLTSIDFLKEFTNINEIISLENLTQQLMPVYKRSLETSMMEEEEEEREENLNQGSRPFFDDNLGGSDSQRLFGEIFPYGKRIQPQQGDAFGRTNGSGLSSFKQPPSFNLSHTQSSIQPGGGFRNSFLEPQSRWDKARMMNQPLISFERDMPTFENPFRDTQGSDLLRSSMGEAQFGDGLKSLISEKKVQYPGTERKRPLQDTGSSLGEGFRYSRIDNGQAYQSTAGQQRNPFLSFSFNDNLAGRSSLQPAGRQSLFKSGDQR